MPWRRTFPGCLEVKLEAETRIRGGYARYWVKIKEDGERMCERPKKGGSSKCKDNMKRCKGGDKLSWKGNEPWYYSEKHNRVIYPWIKGKPSRTRKCRGLWGGEDGCIGFAYKMGHCDEH